MSLYLFTYFTLLSSFSLLFPFFKISIILLYFKQIISSFHFTHTQFVSFSFLVTNSSSSRQQVLLSPLIFYLVIFKSSFQNLLSFSFNFKHSYLFNLIFLSIFYRQQFQVLISSCHFKQFWSKPQLFLISNTSSSYFINLL